MTIHAIAVRPTTPQWMEASFLPSPAPTTATGVTCVVDSGKPRCDETRIVAAALNSALNPCGDWMSVMRVPTVRVPTVRVIRHPPE